jgi:UPF0716 protein FxsA
MFSRLAALFIIGPLLELALLIQVGKVIGTWNTVLLVLITGALGAYLAKREGFRTFFTLRYKLERGILPAEEILDGALILAAGLMLITPGIITDLFGCGLLIRPVRELVKRELKKRIKTRLHIETRGGTWEDFS